MDHLESEEHARNACAEPGAKRFGRRWECFFCKEISFPVYTCTCCTSGALVCGNCKRRRRCLCPFCRKVSYDRRSSTYALLLRNPLHSDWLQLLAEERNQHYVINKNASQAIASEGYSCSTCSTQHDYPGCPLDVIACSNCNTSVMRCDYAYHERNDCADIASKRLVPMHAVQHLERNEQDLPWSCPICLMAVTPVRDLCTNGHLCCAHCWCKLYKRKEEGLGRFCPICRERLPLNPAPQLYHWPSTSEFYIAGNTCLLCGNSHLPGECDSLLRRCPTCQALFPSEYARRHFDKECGRKPSLTFQSHLLQLWSASGDMPCDLLSLSILLCNPI